MGDKSEPSGWKGLQLALVFLLAAATWPLALGAKRAVYPEPPSPARLEAWDRDIRSQAVQRLGKRSPGILDSHPDPELGRTLKAAMSRREWAGSVLDSNSYGLRELRYELPKPQDKFRVVLLGDDLVFGRRREDRPADHLARLLRNHCPTERDQIEVLSFGIPSWNLRSQKVWVLRQLALLQPDLVLHLLRPQAIGDTPGVSGDGEEADFTPQFRPRAQGLLLQTPTFAGEEVGSLLTANLDWTSRERYKRAASDLKELSAALQQNGCPYLLVTFWNGRQKLVPEVLTSELKRHQWVQLSDATLQGEDFWLTPAQLHTSNAGGKRLAELLFGWVETRELLSSPLLERPQARRMALAEEQLANEFTELGPLKLEAGIRFGASPARLKQVHGGISTSGCVSPFAAGLLQHDSPTSLLLRGQRIERGAFDEGAELSIWLEGERIGAILLSGPKRFSLEIPLPKALRNSRPVGFQLRASDYVYTGERLQYCTALVLEELTLQ